MDRLIPQSRTRLIRAAIVAMAVSGFIASVLPFLGRWFWLGELFVHFRPQYCLWLGLALIGAGWVRHRLAMGLAAVGLLANVVALAPYAMPWGDRPAGRTPGRVWTVVTLNARIDHEDPSRVVDYFRRVPADIIVLQEITERWKTALEPLRDLYPHGLTQTRADGFGVALFAREKPVAVSIQNTGGRDADLAVTAEWESEGRRFALAGVHLNWPLGAWRTRNQKVYLEHIEKWCAEKAQAHTPVMVVGDFNATPWSSGLRSFRQQTQLRNTSQGAIFGATWRKWQPWQLLIDHVFLTSDWKLLTYEVGPSVGSDHRPVIVRAALWSK